MSPTDFSNRPTLRPGDRVALLLPGSPAHVDLVLSLLRRGVFCVPMDVGLTPAERAPLLADVDPVLVVEDQEHLEALLTAHPYDPALGPPRGRPVYLTSGTTGRPKGVWSGLLDRGVLIRNTGPQGWLRVTVGTPAENDAFKQALTEVLA